MPPEKPVTPPEKFVAFNGVVYKIIPGSEDFPETETGFDGPHYTRNGLGRWAATTECYTLFTPALGYITDEEAALWKYLSTIHSTLRS